MGLLGPLHLTFTVFDTSTILLHVSKTAFFKILFPTINKDAGKGKCSWVMRERERKEKKDYVLN